MSKKKGEQNNSNRVKVHTEDGSKSFTVADKRLLEPAQALEVYNSFDYGQTAAQGDN